MPKKTVVYIAVLLCIAGVLLWHIISQGPGGSGASGRGCYATLSGVTGIPGAGERLEPVGCDQAHDWEIIVQLDAAGAEEECQRRVDAFLGGPWRQSRVMWGLSEQRRGKAYCGMVETSGTAAEAVGSTASFKDGLRGDRRLAITCLVNDLDDEENLLYGDCAEHHSGEIVGVVADGTDQRAGCPGVAAGYLSLTEAELRDRGDLQVRWFEDGSGLCFVAEPDDPDGRHDTLRATVKGLGKAPLPQ
ncbi:septum formation family protein [Dactylosporangium sp. NPDC049525]|uniref:septum formation family protein n=1 Tax=Dactylosporangium sp. NPDC049525 TaxID=3154730 RepID=UPI003434C0FE